MHLIQSLRGQRLLGDGSYNGERTHSVGYRCGQVVVRHMAEACQAARFGKSTRTAAADGALSQRMHPASNAVSTGISVDRSGTFQTRAADQRSKLQQVSRRDDADLRLLDDHDGRRA